MEAQMHGLLLQGLWYHELQYFDWLEIEAGVIRVGLNM